MYRNIISIVALTLVFADSVNAQFSILHSFTGSTTDGRYAQGSLITDGIYLYGMTPRGGLVDSGTIFQIKFDGSDYTLLSSFNGTTEGGGPLGSLIKDGVNLYGMNQWGGTNGDGIIFRHGLDNNIITPLHSFMGKPPGGDAPVASLVKDGTFLYGMTQRGGISDYGTIFRINLDGSNFAVLHHFTKDTDGARPQGSLITDGTFLYGMTQFSGPNSSIGTVFRIRLNGNDFAVLHNFTGATNDGASPYGSLLINGTFLYGMTGRGGTNYTGNTFATDAGTIFRVGLDGSNFSLLHSFTGTTNDGAKPFGSLITNGMYLYGLTEFGGTTNSGTIFKFGLNGSGFTVLHSLTGTTNDGSIPLGSLIIHEKYLFGLTPGGGSNGEGTIFKLGEATLPIDFSDLTLALKDLTILPAYPNPFNPSTTIRYGLSADSKVIIQIYNITGNLISTLESNNQTQGWHSVQWNGTNSKNEQVPAGIYFGKVTSYDYTKTTKLMLLK